MPDTSMRQFGPRSPALGLVLFACLYVAPGALAALLVLSEHRHAPEGTGEKAVLYMVPLGLFCVVGYLVLVYVVFASRRFHFTKGGFRVYSWRGWQSFEWRHVRRAELSSHRGNIELVLFVGPVRRVTVSMNAFAKARTLLQAVGSRLPVPLVASPVCLERVQDA